MSDTKAELRRDEWIREHYQTCGTCKYVQRYKFIPVYLCTNKECEHYNDYVDLEDGCPEYVGVYPEI